MSGTTHKFIVLEVQTQGISLYVMPLTPSPWIHVGDFKECNLSNQATGGCNCSQHTLIST